VADVKGMKIGETFEKLINYDFGVKIGHFTNRIAFYSLKQVLLIESHYNVEIFMISLLSDVTSQNFTNEIVF